MKKEKILEFLEASPTIQDLRKFAKMLGLRIKRTMRKRDLIRLLKTEANKMKDISSVTSKISTPESKDQPHLPSKPENFDLPNSYTKDKLVMLPVNSRWVYLYWDFSTETQKRVFECGGKLVLRVYDVTNIIFDGSNAHKIKEITPSGKTNNWYLKVDFSDANYLAEIGIIENNKFTPLIRSNIVRTPVAFPKFKEKEEWLILNNQEKKVVSALESEKFRKAAFPFENKPTSFSNPSSEEFLNYLFRSISGRKEL
ncbi:MULTISPECIES: DUF4912 domain-containing protein [Kosmotoga]|uniref:DUF4912 domain-containing protein n=1 Tax=Kosmotoga olearia (strain ATCC BAA-1733 / DSM 21960 / TBF 19.5.1) TaxID=521045 RepID=C5CDT3_KOSOT|nr:MULTISPECIES: DUF4912 domain-containing protein [Kosmotoga]ACR79102.1 conserved hypothetical protein [Kosmotoga olearia TBF 19.5.1]OAA23799.1 hypothetical protein DU53_01850 [Kosmotoga sp. DU53]